MPKIGRTNKTATPRSHSTHTGPKGGSPTRRLSFEGRTGTELRTSVLHLHPITHHHTTEQNDTTDREDQALPTIDRFVSLFNETDQGHAVAADTETGVG